MPSKDGQPTVHALSYNLKQAKASEVVYVACPDIQEYQIYFTAGPMYQDIQKRKRIDHEKMGSQEFKDREPVSSAWQA